MFKLLSKKAVGAIDHYVVSHPCEQWEFGIDREEDRITYATVSGCPQKTYSEGVRYVIAKILESERNNDLEVA